MVQKRSDCLINTCSYKVGQGPFTLICSNWFTNRLRSTFNLDADEAIALRWALMKSIDAAVENSFVGRWDGVPSSGKVLIQMKLAQSYAKERFGNFYQETFGWDAELPKAEMIVNLRKAHLGELLAKQIPRESRRLKKSRQISELD